MIQKESKSIRKQKIEKEKEKEQKKRATANWAENPAQPTGHPRKPAQPALTSPSR